LASLDTRSRDILIILLNATEPLSSVEIAVRLQSTPRKVNYALRSLELWLKQKGYCLSKKKGVGIFLDIQNENKKILKKELEKIEGYELILSPAERIRSLLLALLTESQPLLVKSIAPQLGVSRPTIFNDLNEIERWLNDHKLDLIRRPGFGFKVEGPELEIRKAIESVVLDSIGQVSLLALYQGKSPRTAIGIGSTGGLNSIPVLDLKSLEFETCSNLVKITEEMSHFSFTDSYHLALVLFFCILIYRTKCGNFVREFPLQNPDFIETREYEIALYITQILNDKYNLSLGNHETENIAAHIMSIKGKQSLSNTALDLKTILKEEDIEQIIRDMINEASKMLHPILNIDQQLKRGLLFHIKPVINRLYFGLPIQNFLLDEIKKQYPYIYMIAEKTSKVLESRIGRRVPDAEIGYLAMHFGAAMERLRSLSTPQLKVLVVCGGGCSTSWLLVSKMRAEFPELDIADVKSAIEISKTHLDKTEFDIVISTIPLEIQDIPIIVVNPLLGDVDKQKIRIALGLDNLKPNINQQIEFVKGSSIASLLSEDTIQFAVKASNWVEAVNLSCAPLLQKKSIEGRYVEAIIDLLKQHGPYMVLSSGIVLMHAMTGFGVKRVCMSMTKFSPPINFGHQFNDPVHIGIVFGAMDNRSHLEPLFQLARLLGNQPLMNSLKNSCSREEFISNLYEAIQTSC